jgi:hypothetical protein
MKRMKAAVVITLLAGSSVGFLPRQTASDRPITDLVPADNLVVYVAKPYVGVIATSQSADSDDSAEHPPLSISTVLAFLNASGLIPDEGQVFADIAGALPLLGQFEHALILLDASSRVVRQPNREGEDEAHISLRLKHLQAAVVLRTQDRSRVVLEQLSRIVSRYTNEKIAELTTQKVVGYDFQRLADERLPGWAVWEWGRLGDFFVISFGKDAFEKIAETYAGRTPALSKDAWFRAATAKTNGDVAIAQWFLGFARLQRRLGEVAKVRSQRVIAALGANDMTNDLWTIGMEGRALSWYRCFRRNGEDIVHRYSDPMRYEPRHLGIVPTQARHFAVINVPTRWLVDNLPRAWLAAQSQRNVHKWQQIWQSLEENTGIDLGGNLINHLGEHLILFDFPPHPLDIPFALTIAIEIDDQRPVKNAVDALLSAWGKYLDERAERSGTKLARVKVKHHKADDIWYLQAGILGPALKVTRRYVVISWSPQALRDALQSIEPLNPAEGAPKPVHPSE